MFAGRFPGAHFADAVSASQESCGLERTTARRRFGFTARARLPSRARCCYPARLALRNERILPGLERHMKRRLLAHSLAFFCGARSDTRAACSPALVSASCCKGCFPLKHSIFFAGYRPGRRFFFKPIPEPAARKLPVPAGFGNFRRLLNPDSSALPVL